MRLKSKGKYRAVVSARWMHLDNCRYRRSGLSQKAATAFQISWAITKSMIPTDAIRIISFRTLFSIFSGVIMIVSFWLTNLILYQI